MSFLYETAHCSFDNTYFKFDIYFRITIDISAGGLLVPERVFRTVLSFSALAWFIRYIYIEIYPILCTIPKTSCIGDSRV